MGMGMGEWESGVALLPVVLVKTVTVTSYVHRCSSIAKSCDRQTDNRQKRVPAPFEGHSLHSLVVVFNLSKFPVGAVSPFLVRDSSEWSER